MTQAGSRHGVQNVEHLSTDLVFGARTQFKTRASAAAGRLGITMSYPDFADIREMRDVFAGALLEEPVPLIVGVSAAGRTLTVRLEPGTN